MSQKCWFPCTQCKIKNKQTNKQAKKPLRKSARQFILSPLILLTWKGLNFYAICSLLPKHGFFFSPYHLSPFFFLQVEVPPICNPLSLPFPLFGNFCLMYVQIHLSSSAHLLVTCSQLCKMLTDSGWLCHHSVVKSL